MTSFLPFLAEQIRSDMRWRHLPAPWVVALVIVPLVVFAAWWAYRRETQLARGPKVLLASLRAAATGLVLLVLFAPYTETYDTRTVRSHLVVLVDASQSMATIDGYEDADARTLAKAASIPQSQLAQATRIDLVRRVLSNEDLLERWTKDFRLHVFTFGAQTAAVVSVGDAEGAAETPQEITAVEQVRRRLAEIQATDPATRIGQAVTTVCDTFRVRDEPVAGVVVISDGQENGTAVTPLQAGRRAASMHVPVFAAGVGDPRSPRNVHVGNLRAKEVVLARDTSVFEFGVRAKGFEGRRVKLEMSALDAAGRSRALPVSPAEVVLTGGDGEQEVRFDHRFTEAGLYTLRVGIPVQDEEKIKSDNFVLHTIRVIDRKMKVLFVDSTPRREFHFLSTALVRDVDTMLAHTLLLDADPDTPQRRTQSPSWPALESSDALPEREKLFDYDVVILGDVHWTEFAPGEDKARERLRDLRDFVDKGGGLLMIAGNRFNPNRYKDTDLEAILPIVVDRNAERSDPAIDTTQGFSLHITADGMASPILNVEGDAAVSRDLWEKNPDWKVYWAYPALRAKTLARVLATSGHPSHTDPRYGERPVIATMMYGRGRVLFLGNDEFWRTRKDIGDRVFYRFYGEAVRFLATYKLLGGNRRYKILTDRDQYAQDDVVRITLDVLSKDYEPSKAPVQKLTIELPGAKPGERETVETEVRADPAAPGTFRTEIHATRAGEYRLRGETDDDQEQAPEKIFRVVESTVEGRDLLLDEARLREMAESSEGGRYMLLAELPSLEIPTQERKIPTDKREEDLWDGWWTLAAATVLLGAEWLLRKRWNLV